MRISAGCDVRASATQRRWLAGSAAPPHAACTSPGGDAGEDAGTLQQAATPAEAEGLVPRPPLPPAAGTSPGCVAGAAGGGGESAPWQHPDPARPAVPHQVTVVAVTG